VNRGRDGWHLYRNESPPDLLVAGIASRREFIECLCELPAVFRFNRIADRLDRLRHGCHVSDRNARIKCGRATSQKLAGKPQLDCGGISFSIEMLMRIKLSSTFRLSIVNLNHQERNSALAWRLLSNRLLETICRVFFPQSALRNWLRLDPVSIEVLMRIELGSTICLGLDLNQARHSPEA
jgi:hypothetical protein